MLQIHGGTTEKDIADEVQKAVELAETNRQECPDVGTVLFFDEANSTEAIGLIKEVMCDRSVNGKPLESSLGLHFVVACNPYRK